MNYFYTPTHRLRTLRLMRCGTGRITNGRVYFFHGRLHAFLQFHAATQHVQPFRGLTPRQADSRHGLFRTLLQRHNVRLNIPG